VLRSYLSRGCYSYHASSNIRGRSEVRLRFCALFSKTELSLQSRAHFADLIFQKYPKVPPPPDRLSIGKILKVHIELSLQSRLVHFSGLIFQKDPRTLVFKILKRKPSFRYSLVRILSRIFPDRGPQPRKQRLPFATPGAV